MTTILVEYIGGPFDGRREHLPAPQVTPASWIGVPDEDLPVVSAGLHWYRQITTGTVSLEDVRTRPDDAPVRATGQYRWLDVVAPRGGEVRGRYIWHDMVRLS